MNDGRHCKAVRLAGHVDRLHESGRRGRDVDHIDPFVRAVGEVETVRGLVDLDTVESACGDDWHRGLAHGRTAVTASVQSDLSAGGDYARPTLTPTQR